MLARWIGLWSTQIGLLLYVLLLLSTIRVSQLNVIIIDC